MPVQNTMLPSVQEMFLVTPGPVTINNANITSWLVGCPVQQVMWFCKSTLVELTLRLSTVCRFSTHTTNVHRFQPFKGRNDRSIGVIYFVLLNLPREQRFKWENISGGYCSRNGQIIQITELTFGTFCWWTKSIVEKCQGFNKRKFETNDILMCFSPSFSWSSCCRETLWIQRTLSTAGRLKMSYVNS